MDAAKQIRRLAAHIWRDALDRHLEPEEIRDLEVALMDLETTLKADKHARHQHLEAAE